MLLKEALVGGIRAYEAEKQVGILQLRTVSRKGETVVEGSHAARVSDASRSKVDAHVLLCITETGGVFMRGRHKGNGEGMLGG